MMTELEARIAQECQKGRDEKLYAISHPRIFNGAELKFKALNTASYYRLLTQCTKNGMLDNRQFQAEIICECLVDPNLRSVDLCNAIGCLDPVDIVAKVFPEPGAVKLIRDYIEEVSGFDSEEAEFHEC